MKKSLPLDQIVKESRRTYRITPVKGNYDKSKMLKVGGEIKNYLTKKGHRYTNGIWYINVYKVQQFHTFDIGIRFPYEDGTYDWTYNPTIIKEEIIRQFGSDFYEEWRVFANNRFADLEELLQYVRDDISSIHISPSCCQKSKKLLKRLNMPVIGDWAGLTPSCYQ